VFDQARALEEKVLLIGHHSLTHWRPEFAEQAQAILEQNRDLLVGQLYGHTHVNQFEVRAVLSVCVCVCVCVCGYSLVCACSSPSHAEPWLRNI
jgi:predicted phosphodiesterase